LLHRSMELCKDVWFLLKYVAKLIFFPHQQTMFRPKC
jgi:hypothetical protein